MKLLTHCQANRTKVENRPSCTCHEITHFLSSKQEQSGSKGSENRPSCTSHEITHKLSSQQDQHGNEAVRTDPAAPAMKSLTNCQANRTSMGVKAVRTDPVAPAMKSLTNCQANKTRVVNYLISMSKPSITLLLATLASMQVFHLLANPCERFLPLPCL